MAIVQNLWLKGAKKRLGGAVLYNTSGRTIARALAAEVKNPRTPPQMAQRIKWANLVTFYRANQSWMRKAFETKKQNQSDYNKFMQLNVSDNDIYLTKSEAAEGYCVVAPYRITDGTLMPIEQYTDGEYLHTNIKVDNNNINLKTITIKELTAILTTNNPWIHVGDQISLIINEQRVMSGTGNVYNIVTEQELVLDDISTSPVSDYINAVNILVTGSSNNYTIAFDAALIVGGMAVVLSRQQSGRTLVSPQSLTIVNNEDVIDTYNSQEQRRKALKSYGVNDAVFLDPSDESNKQNPLYGLTIDYFDVDGTKIPPSGTIPKPSNINNRDAAVILSGIINGKATSVTLVTTANEIIELGVIEQSGNTINLNTDNVALENNENHITTVMVKAGGYTLATNFNVPQTIDESDTADDGSTSPSSTEDTEPMEPTPKKTRKKE